MSSLAKTNISISKKDLQKSRIPPVASRNVVFYHKATAGQGVIDLLSLTMPSAEMPTQTQASVDEISGAKLLVNRKNLELVSSYNGQLVQGLDYVITSSYTINLIGPYESTGAEADEIFIGTINSAPISDLVVASAKSVIKTYELAVGATTLNLGKEYQVGVNPNEDVGIIKVYANGVLLLRGEDYDEVDAGSGYGTTIEFAVAPALNPYQVVVDFGVMSITDNDAIGTMESLSGAVIKIAEDLAVVAGTDKNDYFTASPSEVERRGFGDKVLSQDVEIEKLKAIDVAFLTSNGTASSLTGSPISVGVTSLTLSVGYWLVFGHIHFNRGGGSSSTLLLRALWSETSGSFTSVGSGPNIQRIEGRDDALMFNYDFAQDLSDMRGAAAPLLLKVNNPQILHIVTNLIVSGTWSVNAGIIAKKISDL